MGQQQHHERHHQHAHFKRAQAQHDQPPCCARTRATTAAPSLPSGRAAMSQTSPETPAHATKSAHHHGPEHLSRQKRTANAVHAPHGIKHGQCGMHSSPTPPSAMAAPWTVAASGRPARPVQAPRSGHPATPAALLPDRGPTRQRKPERHQRAHPTGCQQTPGQAPKRGRLNQRTLRGHGKKHDLHLMNFL